MFEQNNFCSGAVLREHVFTVHLVDPQVSPLVAARSQTGTDDQLSTSFHPAQKYEIKT
jgi:hypothetical protein